MLKQLMCLSLCPKEQGKDLSQMYTYRVLAEIQPMVVVQVVLLYNIHLYMLLRIVVMATCSLRLLAQYQQVHQVLMMVIII